MRAAAFLAVALLVSCTSPPKRKMVNEYRVDYRGDLEDAVNASKENPIVIAYDHPGGFLTTCGHWSYRVLVHEDGAVDFEGRAGVRKLGDFHWTMPRARVEALLERFEPLWEEPLRESDDVVDAGPSCLFVARSGRRFLKCFIGWREAQRFDDFAK